MLLKRVKYQPFAYQSLSKLILSLKVTKLFQIICDRVSRVAKKKKKPKKTRQRNVLN